jgi:hypothetical protein
MRYCWLTCTGGGPEPIQESGQIYYWSGWRIDAVYFEVIIAVPARNDGWYLVLITVDCATTGIPADYLKIVPTRGAGGQ